MSEEIKELDMDKYLVLEWDDVLKSTTKKEHRDLMIIIARINDLRKYENKKENKYLVLNLEDGISIRYLYEKIALINEKTRFNQKLRYLQVKDIAVALVNAILKTKGD